MSAETRRKAAALMRETAEAACAGPWVRDGNAVRPGVIQPWRALALTYDDDRHMNAEHIASWHPGVALAAADLLGAVGVLLDQRHLSAEIRESVVRDVAADFARAYLGRVSR